MALITNVIKKLKDENFAYFEGDNLMNNGVIIDSLNDPGIAGVAGTVVVAYASAPTGTGFTLTNNDTLEYIAFKYFADGVTPVVADFAGLWFHRKGLPGVGEPGTPGTNGSAAGFEITFDTSTVMEKPGDGKIRANNASLALATELALDERLLSGADISAMVNLLKDGMLFMIRPNANVGVPLAVFELTADPVDNGDWFSIAVTNLVMSSTTFANDDSCTFQFFGAGAAGSTVTEAAVIAAGNFARFADNGAGGYKLIDNANVEVKAATNVFKLSAFTITGVSNLPAANTFPHGTVVRLHEDCLVGSGSNPMGVELWADATNNKWRPHGFQTLFNNDYGLIATPPTCSLAAAGKFDLGGVGDPIIPAGLLNVGSKLRFALRMIKVGTTTPTCRINFGTDMATRTNNSQIWSQQATATADYHMTPEPLLHMVSATTGRTSNRAVRGGGAAGTNTDVTTLLNVAADMKATIEASTLSGDTVYLLGFSIVWEA